MQEHSTQTCPVCHQHANRIQICPRPTHTKVTWDRLGNHRGTNSRATRDFSNSNGRSKSQMRLQTSLGTENYLQDLVEQETWIFRGMREQLLARFHLHQLDQREKILLGDLPRPLLSHKGNKLKRI